MPQTSYVRDVFTDELTRMEISTWSKSWHPPVLEKSTRQSAIIFLPSFGVKVRHLNECELVASEDSGKDLN